MFYNYDIIFFLTISYNMHRFYNFWQSLNGESLDDVKIEED